jgi:hypothetical protein
MAAVDASRLFFLLSNFMFPPPKVQHAFARTAGAFTWRFEAALGVMTSPSPAFFN